MAKTTLFLTGGLIEHVGGSGRLSRLGGMVRTAPVVAVLFLVPALSLAGIPPLSGFVAKLALVEAGVDGTRYCDLVGVAIAREPAHAVLDDEDLVRRLLEPGHERPEDAPHAVGRLGGPGADGGADGRCWSPSDWPSPWPPGRCTATASAARGRPARPGLLRPARCSGP